MYCEMRHILSKEWDRPTDQKCFVELPTKGYVKVLILHVVHASHYFVRLLKHTDVSGSTTDTAYATLTMKIATTNEKNKIRE